MGCTNKLATSLCMLDPEDTNRRSYSNTDGIMTTFSENCEKRMVQSSAIYDILPWQRPFLSSRSCQATLKQFGFDHQHTARTCHHVISSSFLCYKNFL